MAARPPGHLPVDAFQAYPAGTRTGNTLASHRKSRKKRQTLFDSVTHACKQTILNPEDHTLGKKRRNKYRANKYINKVINTPICRPM